MPLAIIRVLALIVCGLAAALLSLNVTQADKAGDPTPGYSNETEARIANLIEPIFGANTFRIVHNASRPEHVSLILDETTFADGSLPIDSAALNQVIATSIALPQDVIWVEIDYAPFEMPAANGTTLNTLNLSLSFAIGLFSLALLWAVTRLTGDGKANDVSLRPANTMGIQHDYADAPSPEKAAALIKSWMREVEPS